MSQIPSSPRFCVGSAAQWRPLRPGAEPDRLLDWQQAGNPRPDVGQGRQTDTLSNVPIEGSFSSDGAQFAYRTGDDSVAGTTLQLYRRGDHADLTLYSQLPIGHGGLPFGPVDQLLFSPDNKLLLDFNEFRPISGIPARFMVFRTADTSVAFQLETAEFGAWAPTGSTVYFFVQGEQGFIGELDSVGASGQAQTVVPSINGFLATRHSRRRGHRVRHLRQRRPAPHDAPRPCNPCRSRALHRHQLEPRFRNEDRVVVG